MWRKAELAAEHAHEMGHGHTDLTGDLGESDRLGEVGVAVAGERRVVDKVVKGAKLHP